MYVTVAFVLVGCAPQESASDPAPNCGWDTAAPAGQLDLGEYLTSTDSWLRAHPDEVPPPPDSPYWLGDCPNDKTNIGPPVDEAGDSHP
jgi:hypothetical protein